MATDDSKSSSLNTLNADSEDAAKKARAPAPASAADIWGVEHCCVREFWAVVETNGNLVRGRNVTYCKKIGMGVYEVYFTGDVSNGVFNATIGRPGYATAPPGEITV